MKTMIVIVTQIVIAMMTRIKSTILMTNSTVSVQIITP